MSVLARFGPSLGFLGWIIQIIDNIDLTVRVNGFLSLPFPIKRLDRQGYQFPPVLYVMALEPLLRKLSAIPRQPSDGKFVTAYADNITITVSEMVSLCKVGKVIKEYKTVIGATVNREKSASL